MCALIAREALCTTSEVTCLRCWCRYNETGTSHYCSKQYAEAFNDFTHAVRLHPSSPVYHCNRAQAALKLGNFAAAAQDAE